jgi:hypothetical protein
LDPFPGIFRKRRQQRRRFARPKRAERFDSRRELGGDTVVLFDKLCFFNLQAFDLFRSRPLRNLHVLDGPFFQLNIAVKFD